MLDQDFLQDLQYALVEPPDGGQSWPSDVWTRELVLDAVNGGCRMLVRDTLCLTLRIEQFVIPGALSVSQPEDWLTTAHLVWRRFPENTRQPLERVDSFESDHGLPAWELTRGQPIGYCDLDSSTLELRLVPTPDSQGFLENLYVPAPESVTGDGLDLAVPDDLLSPVKYDALATLLSAPTRLQDPERAAYCRQRRDIGLLATTLLLSGGA